MAVMDSRSMQQVVHFLSAFSLLGFDTSQPPGEYLVDLDEETVESGSSLAWRRVAAFIHLQAISIRATTLHSVPIAPAFLKAALEQDRKQS